MSVLYWGNVIVILGCTNGIDLIYSKEFQNLIEIIYNLK